MRHRSLFILMALAVFGTGFVSLVPVTPRLIWNDTASLPLGLYMLQPFDALEHGGLVAVAVPERHAGLILERGYLGPDVPLLKRVAAVPGQRVCRLGGAISVDDQVLGYAMETDSLGRPMPVWQGCRLLRQGEIFLMNSDIRNSLDGRYFGVTPTRAVLGRLRPIWTWSRAVDASDPEIVAPEFPPPTPEQER